MLVEIALRSAINIKHQPVAACLSPDWCHFKQCGGGGKVRIKYCLRRKCRCEKVETHNGGTLRHAESTIGKKLVRKEYLFPVNSAEKRKHRLEFFVLPSPTARMILQTGNLRGRICRHEGRLSRHASIM